MLFHVCHFEWIGMEGMNDGLKKRVLFMVFLIGSGIILSTITFAQAGQATPADNVYSSSYQPQGPDNPAELEAFLDDFMEARMEAGHTPGAVIVVVKEGEMFFVKGYGYADVENSVPVDPETTLFDIASVGKLFTWTAVMQLAERDKLDLDTDINIYLTGFKIPDKYPGQPITLKHLMTHTAGFEDRVYDMFPSRIEDVEPLGDWLADHIPARVRPPGEVASYSNYGASLAGYIVERVSGMSYHDYVERNILEPLEMESTSTRTPLPSHMIPSLARGYTFVDGAFEAGDFELTNVAPAGGARASAMDMAKFMIAHLQDGRYGGIRLLEEETARQMRSRLFSHHEQLNGLAHGFIEMNRNGQRIIGHGGGTLLSSSWLALFPDHDLGLLVLYNGDGASSRVFGAFVNHYFPAPEAPTPAPSGDFAARAGRFIGRYSNTRISYTTVEKADALLNPFTFSIKSDGNTLSLGGFSFVETEPLVFQMVDGDIKLVFREDDEGNIQYAFLGDMPIRAFEKIAWYDDPVFFGTLSRVFLGFFGSYLLTFLASCFIKHRRQDVIRPIPRLAQAARLAMVVIAVLNIVFIVGLGLVFDFGDIAAGLVLPLKALLVIPALTTVLWISVVLFSVLAWKNRYWHVLERLHYTLVMLAGGALIWSLNCWNLLGWRF